MLYSLNYHHEGDSKTWYGISAADAPKYEVVMSKTLFPEIVGKQPHHVWAKSSLVEPSVLAGHGVKIVSCVQNSGDFILTSPGGYHQGFCHGYCFAEALNWAPFSWFPYGMAAAKFYREIAFPASVISTDQLLLSCARELSSNSSDLPLLNAVGNSALALLRSLHSQLQTLIREGIEILKFDPGLIRYLCYALSYTRAFFGMPLTNFEANKTWRSDAIIANMFVTSLMLFFVILMTLQKKRSAVWII